MKNDRASCNLKTPPGIALILLVLLGVSSGCESPQPPQREVSKTVRFLSVVADGSYNTVTTTKLTLSFDSDPTGLTADNLTLTGAIKGVLSGSGTTRELAVSGIYSNGSYVAVSVFSPQGVQISPESQSTIVWRVPDSIAFTSMTANGTHFTETTTTLALYFDIDPVDLTADDILVTGATKGLLSKGLLTDRGTIRCLEISDVQSDGDMVSVSINRATGVPISPPTQSVGVFKARVPMTFVSLAANGISNSVSTTALTLTFDADPVGLSIDQIRLVGATKGALSGSGTTRTLTVSSIDYEGVALIVDLTNVPTWAMSPPWRSAVGYRAPPAIAFTGLDANGLSNSVTTTALTLSFDADPVGLAVGDIALSGAVKGRLTGTGTTRTLTVSGISTNGSSVTVSIPYLQGFLVSPSSRSVVVNKGPDNVAFLGLTANGSANTTATTMLTLSFDRDPVGLSVDQLTVTGATKGVLFGGGTIRTLSISGVSSNGATVEVSIGTVPGFVVTPPSRSVAVYKGPIPVSFLSLSADGASNSVTTTQLTLSFDQDPGPIAISDVTLVGAITGALSGTGNSRVLSIAGVPNDQSFVSVTLASPYGYLIGPSTRYCNAFKAPTPVSFTVQQQGGIFGVQNTTSLGIYFDTYPTGFSEGDITVTGATRGTYNGSSTLTISNITVPNGGLVTVTLRDPNNRYHFTTQSYSVAVYRDIRVPLTFTAEAANGGPGDPTTAITLRFNVEPVGIAPSNVGLTGARASSIEGTGLVRTVTFEDLMLTDGASMNVGVRDLAGYAVNTPSQVVIVSSLIGQAGPGGGIVFYDKGYFSDGWRYLEATRSDQTVGVKWDPLAYAQAGSSVSGAFATAVGSGSSNTEAIIANFGTGTYAAQICSDLVQGGKSDWFLPSKDELYRMWVHRALFGNFLVASYWSSSCVDYSQAYAVSLYNGREDNPNPYVASFHPVRAIRAF